MENKFLIGNEIIETAIAAFTAEPCEDTALAVVRTLQQRMNQDGHLLIPVLLSEGGQSYQLRPLEYDGGAVYMVAFTSEAELEKGGPSNILSHFIDVYFDVVLDFEEAQGLVINPFGQPFFLQKDLLAAVLTERPVRDEE
jgi:hypothetical protein